MSAMHFCDKCGKIMKVESNAGLSTASCGCGHYKFVNSGLIMKNKGEIKLDKGKGIADEHNSAPAEGKFPHDCSKCGNDECYVKDLGTFFSDESCIYLFKCTKCGHVDRQADGTSNI